MLSNQIDDQSTRDFKSPRGAVSQSETNPRTNYFNKANGYTGFSNKQSKKSPSSKRSGKS